VGLAEELFMRKSLCAGRLFATRVSFFWLTRRSADRIISNVVRQKVAYGCGVPAGMTNRFAPEERSTMT